MSYPIKRYAVAEDGALISDNQAGEFVLWTDHIRIVDALRAEIHRMLESERELERDMRAEIREARTEGRLDAMRDPDDLHPERF